MPFPCPNLKSTNFRGIRTVLSLVRCKLRGPGYVPIGGSPFWSEDRVTSGLSDKAELSPPIPLDKRDTPSEPLLATAQQKLQTPQKRHNSTSSDFSDEEDEYSSDSDGFSDADLAMEYEHMVKTSRNSSKNRDSAPIDIKPDPSVTYHQAKADGGYRYCRKCRIVKPDRAHHCSSSDRCVLCLDHYCPWVGTAVGFQNRKMFLLFLTYA